MRLRISDSCDEAPAIVLQISDLKNPNQTSVLKNEVERCIVVLEGEEELFTWDVPDGVDVEDAVVHLRRRAAELRILIPRHTDCAQDSLYAQFPPPTVLSTIVSTKCHTSYAHSNITLANPSAVVGS